MASSSGLPTAPNLTKLASPLTRYLTGRDFSRCIQVNKAWFATFTPHIWESPRVSDNGFRGRPHDMGALSESLRLVLTLQELVIFDMAPLRTRNLYLDVLVDAYAPTTNLKRLVCFQGTVHESSLRLPTLVATHGAQELGTPIRTKVDDRDRVVRKLRGCGPALQRLQFDAFADEKAEYLFDAVQRSCTNLRQLSFAKSNDIQGNKGLWIYLLEICPSLEVLIICNNI
ncbi:hypothetical protein BGX24_009650 [Mortierella sp. AD032]|nr:hypothetical protein BGX24_009650 [Mortierella sp. AD032]